MSEVGEEGDLMWCVVVRVGAGEGWEWVDLQVVFAGRGVDEEQVVEGTRKRAGCILQ